jgi:hypothetical protein
MLYVYHVKNTKCNVLYIFIFCSILTKRSSEKYTTDIKTLTTSGFPNMPAKYNVCLGCTTGLFDQFAGDRCRKSL